MNKKILNEVGEIRKLMGLLNEQPSLNTGTTDTDIPEWLQTYFDYSDITFKDVIADEFAILRHLKDHRCTSVEECYKEALNLPTDGLDENLKKRLDLITLKLGKLRVSKYTLGDV